MISPKTGVNARVVDDLLPVGRVFGKTEAAATLLGPRFDLISADNQTRLNLAFPETILHGPVRTAVDLTHPAHADDADANFPCHFSPSIGQRDRP